MKYNEIEAALTLIEARARCIRRVSAVAAVKDADDVLNLAGHAKKHLGPLAQLERAAVTYGKLLSLENHDSKDSITRARREMAQADLLRTAFHLVEVKS